MMGDWELGRISQLSILMIGCATLRRDRFRSRLIVNYNAKS